MSRPPRRPKPLTLETAGFGEWVIPTGGGYFFSPAIEVIAAIPGKH
jgi:hypothetical protein